MKTYLAIFIKEFYHIIRDTRTLFILIALPIAQVLIFGYAVTNEFKDSKIAVIDQAKDDLSQSLIYHIQSSGHFLVSHHLSTEAEVDAAFKKGLIKMALVIPANLSNEYYRGQDPTIQLLIDGSEPNFANTMLQYASYMIQQFSLQMLESNSIPGGIAINTRMIFNPELKSAYNFLPGVISMILLLISAMMTALTIAKEKETGTMEMLLVSPVSPLTIILGKVGPYALLSFIDAVLILVVGYFVFGVPIIGSLTLLLAMCALYVITSLSLGIFISSKAPSMKVAMMASIITLMMPSVLLSGFIFPISSMPVPLQFISKIVPTTYFIEIVKGVMLKGNELSYIIHPMLILIAMTLVFLLLSLKSFKTRIE